MPRFSANLTFLWPELDPYDRIQAAADAGFSHVEILFPYQLDVDRLERELSRCGLQLALFDAPPGDREHGERGMLCIPGREEECLETVQQALELAQRFGTRRINVLAGVIPEGLPRGIGFETAAATLRRAAALAEPVGVELLVENISPAIVPGYFAGTVEQAAELVTEVDHPLIRLQLDQYHISSVGADPVGAAEKYAALIGHVQIADAPGRHQPGTGSAPIGAFLQKLDELGYEGYAGLEYAPEGSMEQALAWLPRERRAVR